MTLSPPAMGLPDPVVLSSLTEDIANATLSGTGGSAVWPSANAAYFYPVRLTRARTYTKAWWLNGATVNGNVDVGIYTISGTTATRIVASTAEAQAGASDMQVAATFTTTTIGPGLYFLAMSCSSGTATFWRASASFAQLRALPAFTAATAHPLGATPTVALMGQSFAPAFGFAERTTI